jgi:hypothetical protein
MINMNKEFVPQTQALALKELGFDESCFGYYNVHNQELIEDLSNNRTGNNDSRWVSAPLYQQAFRWFREKYGHYSEIRVGCTQIDGSIGYAWWVWKPWSFEEWSPEVPGEEWSYYDYEEAETACLDKLIEICKNK